MIGVQLEFDRRVLEIEEYVKFLEKIESNQVLLTIPNSNSPAFSSQEQNDLLRTLKANAFLLLYNLVESTIVNAVEAIFDEFSTQGVSFDACRKEVQLIVLDNLKCHKTSKILPRLNAIAIDVVAKTFQKDRIVSGNVDARKIKEMAEAYGFLKPSADGDQLLTVKSNRNDLAHGVKSFSEVGRDFLASDISPIKTKVIHYLNTTLANIASYIRQREYLATP
jgi:hypothetical protein